MDRTAPGSEGRPVRDIGSKRVKRAVAVMVAAMVIAMVASPVVGQTLRGGEEPKPVITTAAPTLETSSAGIRPPGSLPRTGSTPTSSRSGATVSMNENACGTCGRRLNQPSDELSEDCGGDCWGCIGEIEALGGYPPSLCTVRAEIAAGIRKPVTGLPDDGESGSEDTVFEDSQRLFSRPISASGPAATKKNSGSAFLGRDTQHSWSGSPGVTAPSILIGRPSASARCAMTSV
jgi:hypothetical protein